MSKQQGGKAPDNNRRLAALEAGVSALAISLTANGVVLADGGDPIEAAIGRVKHAAELDARVLALVGAATSVIGRFAPDMELAPLSSEEQLIDVQIRLLGQLATSETPCDRTIAEQLEQISAMGANVERLENKLGATTAELEELKGKLTPEGGVAAEGDVEADRLRARVVELEEEVKELNADVDDLASEKNRLANELTAALEGRPAAPSADAGGDDPEEVAAPAVRERPETARDVGPEFPGIHSSAELADLFAGGGIDALELAFSNGEYEILSLQPVAIAPSDLQPAEGRLLVAPAIHAKLAATDAPEEIAGVGLLMQGEQIGYCAFPDRLTMQPGSERRFDRAIFF